MQPEDDIVSVELCDYENSEYYSCMPTADDFNELVQNCVFLYTSEANVNGIRYTSQTNGNYIFIPNNAGIDSQLWSSTGCIGTQYDHYATYWYWDDDYSKTGAVRITSGNKYFKYSVRPILKRKKQFVW